MTCAWCGGPLPPDARADSRFCSRACRQSAYRLRKRAPNALELASKAARLAYADPPYPGRAWRYYGREATYAGEVDHAALIARLGAQYDGWALSTAEDALRRLLPLCPERAFIAPWVKPIGASPNTSGRHNTWEPVIVVPARALKPGVRDWLLAQPARGGGTLPGRKPLAFAEWVFRLLGACRGDSLDDLYPGTGIMGRAFLELYGPELATS